MNLRGKKVYVVTGLILLVIVVAWFFLIMNPLRTHLHGAKAELQQTTADLAAARVHVVRLRSYQKASSETQADVLRLHKMMPGELGIPSLIVALTQTAEQSGLTFAAFKPASVSQHKPLGVETINLGFTGNYLDLQDFLSRLESYVTYQNSAFQVTGRLLQVSRIALTEGPNKFPDLAMSLVLEAFQWNDAPSYSGGAAAKQLSAPPSPTPLPSPSSTSTAAASPLPDASESTPDETPSESATPATTATPSGSEVP